MDVHCKKVIGKGRRAAWICLHVLTGLMAHASAPLAQPGPAASRVIAPTEQAARDGDRLEILRAELKKSEDQLESLVRRQAERLATHDIEAAVETEAQRARTLGDITALKREISSASVVAGRPMAVRPSAFEAPRGRPASSTGAAPAPWWDVYRNGRHDGPPAFSPSPAPEQSARPAPARLTGVAP